MADADVADLAKLDRDVARAAARLDAGNADAAFAGGLRRVAGHSTYAALGELVPSAHDAPLRDGLRAWVYALTQARIAGDLDEARRAAESAATGRFDGDEPRLVSWREAWRGVAAAKGAAEARQWLSAASDVAPKLAAIARERAERQAEVARRMGVVGGEAALAEAARALLDATEDLARETNKETARRVGDAPEAVFVDAVARDAGEGWPARLTARWLDDVVGKLSKGLSVRAELPARTLGASSFARALGAFGFALRAACAASAGLPFAIAREPGYEAEHLYAFLLSSLAADIEFQRRALGVARSAAAAQARALARTALLDARLHAARMILARDADRFEELGARLFGAPLPRPFAGAWPRARDDEASRFSALLALLPLREALVARHDLDWWRNPRAAAELRGRGSLPGGAAREIIAGSAEREPARDVVGTSAERDPARDVAGTSAERDPARDVAGTSAERHAGQGAGRVSHAHRLARAFEEALG